MLCGMQRHEKRMSRACMQEDVVHNVTSTCFSGPHSLLWPCKRAHHIFRKPHASSSGHPLMRRAGPVSTMSTGRPTRKEPFPVDAGAQRPASMFHCMCVCVFVDLRSLSPATTEIVPMM